MTILIILDGWGIGRADDSNPIHVARPEWFNFFQTHFPPCALQAHGLTVGAGWEEPGSSELGHLAIGTGRTVSDEERKSPPILHPLCKVLADNGKKILKVAESKKEESVTYYMNGLEKTPFLGEFRVILPSKELLRPETHVEMQATALTDRALAALNEGGFDLIIINYANPDIIANTGNFEATRKAIQAVDKELGRLYENALPQGHAMLIVGSHGNAEMVLNPLTGKPEKENNRNPVPFCFVEKSFERPRARESYTTIPTIGFLSDVAPTILECMNLPVPPEMTGESLIPQLIN